MQRTYGLPKSQGGAQCNTKSSSAKVVKVTRKIGPLPGSKGGGLSRADMALRFSRNVRLLQFTTLRPVKSW